MVWTSEHAGYVLSDEAARLDFDAIHAYLTRSYWSPGIPKEIVIDAARNSLCVGIYTAEGKQVGYLRAISDYATFAYLCDVYVLEEHRRRGLAKAGVKLLLSHPKLQNLRALRLVTKDAHPLYAQFGFTVIKDAPSHMEKREQDVYRRKGS